MWIIKEESRRRKSSRAPKALECNYFRLIMLEKSSEKTIESANLMNIFSKRRGKI